MPRPPIPVSIHTSALPMPRPPIPASVHTPPLPTPGPPIPASIHTPALPTPRPQIPASVHTPALPTPGLSPMRSRSASWLQDSQRTNVRGSKATRPVILCHSSPGKPHVPASPARLSGNHGQTGRGTGASPCPWQRQGEVVASQRPTGGPGFWALCPEGLFPTPQQTAQDVPMTWGWRVTFLPGLSSLLG